MRTLQAFGVMLGTVSALLFATPALAAGRAVGHTQGHGNPHRTSSVSVGPSQPTPVPTAASMTAAAAGTPAPVTRPVSAGPLVTLPIGPGITAGAGVGAPLPIPAPAIAPVPPITRAEPIVQVVRVLVPARLPGYVAPLLLGVTGAILLVALILVVRWRRYSRRNAALERAKSDFLMQASHELRTPLSVVAGYLSLASEGDLGELPDDFRRVLPVMADKVGEIERLVGEMLLATAIGQGRLKLRRQPLDLRTLVAESALAARARMGPGQRLAQTASPGPVLLEADPDYLAQIVGALLDNAFELSPPGGVVTIGVRTTDGFAEVVVRDEGAGIPEADLDRIFSRFGRVDDAESRTKAGTGLGLYLSRELARLAGGDITVRSSIGAGSEFCLRLPLATRSG